MNESVINGDWIKLHRKILKWRWSHDPIVFRVWVQLLLEANFRDGHFERIEVKRGQLVFGRNKLAEEIGISIQQLRTALKKLEDTGEIIVKSTNRFSVLTIVNYDEYQAVNQQTTNEQPASNQQLTSKQQTNNKRITTIEERKKERIYTIAPNDSDESGSRQKKTEEEKVIDAYNSALSKTNPKVIRTNPSRSRAVKSFLTFMGNDLEAVERFFEKASKSDFVTGKIGRTGEHANFRVNFDWLINITNATKLLEGNYDNRTQQGREEPVELSEFVAYGQEIPDWARR